MRYDDSPLPPSERGLFWTVGIILLCLAGFVLFWGSDDVFPLVQWPMFSSMRSFNPPEGLSELRMVVVDREGERTTFDLYKRLRPAAGWSGLEQRMLERAIDDEQAQAALLEYVDRSWIAGRVTEILIIEDTWVVDYDAFYAADVPYDRYNPTTETVLTRITVE